MPPETNVQPSILQSSTANLPPFPVSAEKPQRSRRRWPLRWTIVAFVLIGLGGAGIVLQRYTQQQANQQLLKMAVPAKILDLTERLRVSGQVQPIRQVNVSPRESGRLIVLYVDQGDFVREGQLLARMDFGDLSGDLIQAQGRIAELQAKLAEQQAGELTQVIASAQAKVDAAQSKTQLAQAEAERYQMLAQEGAINSFDMETKLATREQAEADLRAAQQDLALLQVGTRAEELRQTQAQILQAQGQLRQQQARVNETEIRAPFSGIITQRFADVGAFVAPTTSASDATAASSSSILALAEGIEVRADVPEAQIASVQVGQSVEVQSSAFPDRVVKARVKRIAPATVVVKEVTVFRVFIEPLSGADFLRAGMNTSVSFIGQQLPKALTVPAVALIYQGGKTGVIIWDTATQQPAYREVKTGITQNGVTQILEGLEAEDQVFTTLPPGKTLKDFTGESTESSPSR